MSSFFWYQVGLDTQSPWRLGSEAQRAAIVAREQPPLATILNASAQPEENWTRAEFLAMKYSGPLYMDFDGETIAEALADAKATVLALRDGHGVEPDALMLFATGGRGFHIVVPAGVFRDKPEQKITQLPLVYRSMVETWAQPTSDMSIYSCRRGRMFRISNVQRANGRYKVPLTWAELQALEEKDYEKLTAAPRYYNGLPIPGIGFEWLFRDDGKVTPPLVPTRAPSLAALFEDKQQKTNKLLSRQRKTKPDTEVVTAFGGMIPVGLQELFAGQHLDKNAGFNSIALQFAITAVAFGLTEAKFLELCDELIKNHEGDGNRYSTPGRRRRALADRYQFVAGGDVYVFTLGGLRSVCDHRDLPADLFKPLADLPTVSTYLSEEELAEGTRQTYTEEQIGSMQMALHDYAGIRVTDSGIYQRAGDDEGFRRLSNMAIVNPMIEIDYTTGALVSISCKIAIVSETKAKNVYRPFTFSADDFTSRIALDRCATGLQGHYRGTDVCASDVRSILVDAARRVGAVRYVLHRTGLDVVNVEPGWGKGKEKTLVWVTKDGVTVPDAIEGKVDFIYRPLMSEQDYATLDCLDWEKPAPGDPVMREFLELLFASNRTEVVGIFLGWMVSCFHRSLHQETHQQFPLLWIYGPAGSGKTTSMQIYYYLFSSKPPQSWPLLQGGVTKYAWQTMVSRSVTAPLIVDEFKEREFLRQTYSTYLAEFRSAYNSGIMARGGVDTGAAKGGYRQVREIERSTPLCVISETLTNETATLQRAVPVAVSPQDANLDAWAFIEQQPEMLTRIGGMVLRRSLQIKAAEFKALWREKYNAARMRLKHLPSRVPVAYAVVQMGLEFLRDTLKAEMGYELPILDEMVEKIFEYAQDAGLLMPLRSEAIKAFQEISYLTYDIPESDPSAIRCGMEYAFYEGYLHIDVYALGMRYINGSLMRHMTGFYTSVESFTAGVIRMSEIVSQNAPASPLNKFRGSRILVYDVQKLLEQNVRPFKGYAES